MYNKGKIMRKKINEQSALSGAGQKLEAKLDKIPGLDDLLAGVKGKANNAQILLQIAEKLGGEKEPASGLLKAAAALAQKEEAKPKTATPPGSAPGSAPGAAPGAAPDAAPAPLVEFISYLFEGTDY